MCGDHRRVISGRHLSKHGTDRQEYMEEFGLSPDELIARDFRIIQSSRRPYQPHGKKEWIAAIKKVCKRDGNVFAIRLRKKYPHLYYQGKWISVIGIKLSVQPDLIQIRCGYTSFGTAKR